MSYTSDRVIARLKRIFPEASEIAVDIQQPDVYAVLWDAPHPSTVWTEASISLAEIAGSSDLELYQTIMGRQEDKQP